MTVTEHSTVHVRNSDDESLFNYNDKVSQQIKRDCQINKVLFPQSYIQVISHIRYIPS